MNKSNYIELNSNDKVNSLLENIVWEDAFIKESHSYSASYLTPYAIFAADSAHSLRLAICLPENGEKIVEFLFESVEEVFLSVQMDIMPRICFKHNCVEFSLFEGSNHITRCRSVFFRVLENFYSSDCAIYTSDDLYATNS